MKDALWLVDSPRFPFKTPVTASTTKASFIVYYRLIIFSQCFTFLLKGIVLCQNKYFLGKQLLCVEGKEKKNSLRTMCDMFKEEERVSRGIVAKRKLCCCQTKNFTLKNAGKSVWNSVALRFDWEYNEARDGRRRFCHVSVSGRERELLHFVSSFVSTMLNGIVALRASSIHSFLRISIFRGAVRMIKAQKILP